MKKKPFFSLALIASLTLLAPHVLLGQTLPPKVSSFTQKNYNGPNQILCIQTLQDGRTAFGTYGGLTLYDGERYRLIPLKKRFVRSIDQGPSGRIYIGASGEMGVIVPDEKGRLHYRSLLHMLPDSVDEIGNVLSTRCVDHEEVYFTTKQRLFHLKEDSLSIMQPGKAFFLMTGPTHRPIIQDKDSGLVRLKDGTMNYLKGSRSLSKERLIHGVHPYPGKKGDRFLVFTREDGLFLYDPDKGNYTPFSLKGEKKEAKEVNETLKAAKVYTTALLDPGSNLYGASYFVGTVLQGCFFLSSKGKILKHIGTDQGLPSDLIRGVHVSEKGGVQVATNKGFAFIHSGRPFSQVEEGELYQGSISDLSFAGGSLLLATGQGAWRWNEGTGAFANIPGIRGKASELLSVQNHLKMRSNDPKGILEDLERTFLTMGGIGLFAFGPQRGSEADTVFMEEVSELDLDVLGSSVGGMNKPLLLAGGRGGLFLFSSEVFEEDPAASPVLSFERSFPEVIDVMLHPDPTSRDSFQAWMGFVNQGVLKLTVDTGCTGYEVTRYDHTDGLPKSPIRLFRRPDSGKGILFGTDRGLYRLRKARFVPFCQYGDLFCDGSRQIFSLKNAKGGRFYINDAKGGNIKELTPRKGTGYRIDSVRYRALNMGEIRAFQPYPQGSWLGGPEGLARHHPDLEVDVDRPWNCLLDGVLGSDDSLLFGGVFRKELGSSSSDTSALDILPQSEQPQGMIPHLPFSKNRMEFLYSAPFPSQQERVSYAYKLEGFDTSWSKWTEDLKKEYTNLPEGSYTFKVKARNGYLKESRTATYRFRILPPWYRTWTAYGGYMISGVGFLWLLLWLNGRRLEAQKQRLERIVKQRTQEIQEQKQEVEQQKREVEKAHERISEAHEEISQSIDYAKKIQFALLRSEEQVSSQGPEHFIFFRPQTTVSGDFYWIREHNGFFYMAAVDCTGHGVPGAFMSMLGISQLNEIMSTEDTPEPGTVLNELRRRVVRELSGTDDEETAKDGMDAALVRIPVSRSDQPEGKGIEVSFAGAQNPLYVVRKGIGEEGLKVEREGGESLPENRVKPFKGSADGIEIKGDAMPVGYDDHAKEEFHTIHLSLQKGDMLYLFSDGYADQFGGPKGKKFRYGPFKRLLADIHEHPMEEQKKVLERTFEDWKKETEQEQIDDVLVMGIRL